MNEPVRPDVDRGDAFGQMLRDYRDGDEGAAEIVERDDGWIGVSAGGAAYFSGYEDWSESGQRAIDRVDGRVLDVGCGAGRHALALQERGCDVTGIDVSPGAIEVAKDRGVEDVRLVDVADVADEFEPGTFDAIVMMGNNFGLVGTADRAPEILDDLAAVAADDAALIAQSRDPTATDEEAHLAYHEWNRERGRLPGALRIRVRYETLATDWYDYLLAAPETMADLASETRWTFDGVLGDVSETGDYVGVLRK